MKIWKKYSLALVILLPVLLLVLIFSFRLALQRVSADFFHPYLRPLGFFDKALVDSSAMLLSKRELSARLAASETELMKLKAQNIMLDNLRGENRELRKMLSLEAPREYFCVHAEVLARDPLFWFENFTIDKGENSGIKVGSIVLSFSVVKDSPFQFAVAGRVVSVAKNSSVVHTVASKNCSFGGFLPEEYLPCIIEGGYSENGRFYFLARYIPASEALKGDIEISTSPFSREIPPLLPLGRASLRADLQSNARQDGFYQTLTCESYANLSRTQFVVVMVKK